MEIKNIRPHHLVCIEFFVGNGYSDEFTSNMRNVIRTLALDPILTSTAKADGVCAKCPNMIDGVCKTCDKVDRYDREVLKAIEVADGETAKYTELQKKVREKIIYSGKRESICGDCEWSELCKIKPCNKTCQSEKTCY